nr:retrovirus-related Pol polyprotein from transposon TNT 1-94 [Tanacetum cinerariifolium]
VDTQLEHEIFQRDNSFSQQCVSSFDQLFEINELNAQSKEKDMVIKKLKERIKSLSENIKEEKIKQELEEIETINIELDHRMTKLIAENEHLKQAYKQLYDSIKSSQAVAAACYTQNRSIIRLRHDKTPYELLHGKLPDLSFLHVFGALCYPTNGSENLGKLQPKANIEMASEQSSSGPALHEMTPATINSVIAPIAEVIALEPAEPTDSPSSTTLDQDAPSPSKSQTIPKTQPPVIPHDVKEDNHDIEVAHMGNDLFYGMPILEVASDQSSSTDSIHTIVHPRSPNFSTQ